MCVARGELKNKAELFTSTGWLATSQANHLAQRLDVPCSRLNKTAPPSNGSRRSKRFNAKSTSSPSVASAKCNVSQSQSQEKHPCSPPPSTHTHTHHQHTHARTGVEECERRSRRAQRTRRLSGRRGDTVQCSPALLTYSVLVFPSGGTRWPPFSKRTAFSVKTILCACATGSVAPAACTYTARTAG